MILRFIVAEEQKFHFRVRLTPLFAAMRKTTTPFEAQLVAFHTSLPFDQVTAQLDQQTHRSATEGALGLLIQSSSSKTELEAGIQSLQGGGDGRDLMLVLTFYLSIPYCTHGSRYFSHFVHQSWLRLFNADCPRVNVYTVGNPLVAETMLRHDLSGVFNIPPRLAVLECPDGGTRVLYHLPSSVMRLYGNDELNAAALQLDAKLEDLITKVVQDE